MIIIQEIQGMERLYHDGMVHVHPGRICFAQDGEFIDYEGGSLIVDPPESGWQFHVITLDKDTLTLRNWPGPIDTGFPNELRALELDAQITGKWMVIMMIILSFDGNHQYGAYTCKDSAKIWFESEGT